VVGTGDFNGDSNSDILWRDTSGNTSIWFMNGTTVLSNAGVGNIGTNWSLLAPATSTATARPTSCGATSAAIRRSG
jgi:hypothetical protein